MDKFTVEFVGTFLLLSSSMIAGHSKYSFLVAGLALAILIFIGNLISSGPVAYNPAKVFMLYDTNSLSGSHAVYYVLLEIGATILAINLYRQFTQGHNKLH